MEQRQFYFQLTGVVILCIAAILGCNLLLPIAPYTSLGVIGLIFFVFLSVVMFKFAKKLSKSENLNHYTHLIMYNMMAKLFCSFIIIVLYYMIVKPEDRLFIVPYMLIYLIFTIFEAIFLSREAKQR